MATPGGRAGSQCCSMGSLAFRCLCLGPLRASRPVIPLCFWGFWGEGDQEGDGTANENGCARRLMVGRLSMSRR
jgi:hypothetical protein